jgi:hypothetical protein
MTLSMRSQHGRADGVLALPSAEAIMISTARTHGLLVLVFASRTRPGIATLGLRASALERVVGIPVETPKRWKWHNLVFCWQIYLVGNEQLLLHNHPAFAATSIHRT